MMEQNPETLKVAEVAAKLRVDARTVYRMIDRGELQAIRVGRLIRIPAAALETMIGQPVSNRNMGNQRKDG